MSNMCPPQNVENALQDVKDLLEKEISLTRELQTLAEKCQSRQWLLDGRAEKNAAELCQLVAEQKKLLDQNKLLLDGTPDLNRAAEVLAKELER